MRFEFLTAILCALGCALWPSASAYELKVDIEDIPIQGPRNKPDFVEEKWGSKEAWAKGAVVELDDGNFEHLTQAASGATSGDWFIMYGAPWCKYCREEMMVLNWNQTSRELYGEVSVGYIDASNNPFTAKRFNINAYPEFLFLRNGRAYIYKGPRYWKHFVAFARLDWEKAPSFEIIPAHNTLDEYIYNTKLYLAEMQDLFQKRPLYLLFSIVVGVLLGFVLPYGYILSAPYDPEKMIPKKSKDTKQIATKVWNPTTGKTEEIPISSKPLETIAESPSESAGKKEALENASITQVEVDADTVEIVTNPANSTRQGERKNKKKGKKH